MEGSASFADSSIELPRNRFVHTVREGRHSVRVIVSVRRSAPLKSRVRASCTART